MPLIKCLLQFAVHQYGLTARSSKEKDFKVRYAQRELLGISEQDLSMLNELVIEQISKS
ncbi:TPA: phage virion morphogenesis protein [Haemophilus influenzae]